jgi:CelD/BcsL family acetyltransferase involved in cellulose biosynthesis
VQRFHREAARAMLRAGMLRLYALLVAGRLAAVLYGFRDRRRFYYYLAGFDPALGKVSPGTLVVGHAIEEAAREGAGDFDFLRGQEAYKYLWGAQEQCNYRRRLTPRPAADGITRGETFDREGAP